MTQEEMKEGNRIIAEYMGWTIEVDSSFANHERVNVRYPNGQIANSACLSIHMEPTEQVEEAWNNINYRTHYNTDWNELISVVKRLLAEHRDGWESPYAAQMIKDSIRETLSILEIEPLWSSVVDAIKELNKTNSNGKRTE